MRSPSGSAEATERHEDQSDDRVQVLVRMKDFNLAQHLLAGVALSAIILGCISHPNTAKAAGGQGAPGYAGVTLDNPAGGTVSGGNGGAGNSPSEDGGAGGIGADVSGSGSATNSGTITAGSGGFGGFGVNDQYQTGHGGNGGAGGTGVTFSNTGASFTNSGSVTAGAGGSGAIGANGAHNTGYGGSGGAGGAGAIFTGSDASFANSGTVTAGAGGSGGPGSNGGDTGYGGNGGNGGAGVVFAGAGALFTNSGTITAGDAAQGGLGSNGGTAGYGGNGGTGGAGIVFSGSSSSLINNGSVRGGTGGYRGSGLNGDGTSVPGMYGDGGIGITGAGLAIINNGTISGGSGWYGRANAITFTGGTNSLKITSSSTITGNVAAYSTLDTFGLTGADIATFDLSRLGPANGSSQYQGFGIFEKSGSGTWTMAGSAGTVLAYRVSDGVLDLGGTVQNATSLLLTGGTLANGTLTSNGQFYASWGTISANLAGTGAFIKSGADKVILSGANSYTGGTLINAGTLQIGDGSSDGVIAGDITNQGVLAFNNAAPSTIAGAISGAGSVNQLGPGTTILTGTNSFTGGTTINLGTLQIGNGGTTGSIVGPVANNDTLAFNRSDSITFGGVITGIGGVSQTGSGTTILTGANTYLGGTTVNAGTLSLGAGGSLAATGAVSLSSTGAKFDISSSNSNQTIGALSGVAGSAIALGSKSLTFGNASNRTYAGSISGTGSFVKQGIGTQVLTADNSGFAGTTSVTSGTLIVEDRLAGSAVVNGGTLQFGNGTYGAASNLTGPLSITGAGSSLAIQGAATLAVAGDLNLNDNTRLAIGVGSGGSPLRSTGANIGAGVSFDLSGITGLGQLDSVLIDTTSGINGDFASVSVGGFNGTVDYLTLNTHKSADNRQYIASYGLSWAANNSLAHGTFTLTNATDMFDVGAVLADQAANAATGWNGTSLTKAGLGTLVLSGDNSYTGGTVIDDGTLQIGNGATSGSITGDVANNGTLAFNRSDSIVFAGAVSGGGAVSQIGSGTTILAGANSYAGGTVMAAGTLQVSSDANLGASAGGLTFSGGTLATTATLDTGRLVTLNATGSFDVADRTTLGLTGPVTGLGDLLKKGAGALRLDSNGNAYGNTLVEAGTLIGNAASISGNIANAGTLIFDQTVDGSFGGSIGGFNSVKGQGLKEGGGNLTLMEPSSIDWTIASGTLSTAAERFTGNAAIDAPGTLVFDQTANASYIGAFSGTGSLVKAGNGALIFDGAGAAFTGTTFVTDGALIVGSDNAHADTILGGAVLVGRGGLLAGHGTVGSGTVSTVTIGSGGVLSPGNSIGTLTINGNLVIGSGALFRVEVDPAGTSSDLVHVIGNTTINGGTVEHIGNAGAYRLRSSYPILVADGSLSGRFDGVTSDFAFLTATLGYDAHAVSLALARNDAAFASAALTRNQAATAASIDGIGIDAANPVYDAVATLADDKTIIRSAFDRLSGEAYASAKSLFIEDSGFLRAAMTERMRAAFGSVGASAAPIVIYGQKGPRWAPPSTDGLATWGQGFGTWATAEGNGNAARSTSSTGGFLMGIDAPLGEEVKLGVIAGYSHTNFDIKDRLSSGSADSYHLGAYGGANWGPVGFRSGISYSWHDGDTQRSVVFPGFAESLTGNQHSRTFQAFGDLGYRIDTPAAFIEPFGSLAYINLSSGGFRENGGMAALHGASQTTDTTFTTLGLRTSREIDFAAVTTSARATFGWRHAFGTTTPLSTQALSAGEAFTVAGAPIAKDAALIEAGLDTAITKTATVGLSYTGQIASDAQQHGFKANLAVKF